MVELTFQRNIKSTFLTRSFRSFGRANHSETWSLRAKRTEQKISFVFDCLLNFMIFQQFLNFSYFCCFDLFSLVKIISWSFLDQFWQSFIKFRQIFMKIMQKHKTSGLVGREFEHSYMMSLLTRRTEHFFNFVYSI